MESELIRVNKMKQIKLYEENNATESGQSSTMPILLIPRLPPEGLSGRIETGYLRRGAARLDKMDEMRGLFGLNEIWLFVHRFQSSDREKYLRL